MSEPRSPKILFRIPFTIYWIGRLPDLERCCGHKYLAIFKRTFGKQDIPENIENYQDGEYYGWRVL